MNTFKAVVLLCAVLGASCSQHLYHRRGWESPALTSTGTSEYGPAQKQTQTWSAPATEAPLNAYGPASAPVPATPSVSSSGDNEAAAPAATHQVCTCVALPAFPAAPEVRPNFAPAAPAKPDDTGAHQSYNAAPAAQQTYTAPAASATPAPAQHGAYSRHPATSAPQRPANAAYPPAKTY